MFLFSIKFWPLGFHSTAMYVSGAWDPSLCKVGIKTNSGCSISRKDASDGNFVLIAD